MIELGCLGAEEIGPRSEEYKAKCQRNKSWSAPMLMPKWNETGLAKKRHNCTCADLGADAWPVGTDVPRSEEATLALNRDHADARADLVCIGTERRRCERNLFSDLF